MITTTKELLERLEKLDNTIALTVSETCGDVAATYHQLTVQAAHNFIKNTVERNAAKDTVSVEIADQISDSQDNLIGTLEVLGNQLSRSIDYLTSTINRK